MLRHPLVSVRVVAVLLYVRRSLDRRPVAEITARVARVGTRRWRGQGRLVAGTYIGTGLLLRYPVNPEGDCLSRSLLAVHLARRSGLDDVVLHLGVKREHDRIAGHAWTTAAGEEVGGTHRDGHVETLALPT